MDGRVIDVAWPLRRFIVGMILIKRPAESAHAYQSVWTPAGSPLIVTSRNVQKLLQARVNVPVELAMRYQNPAIPAVIRKLAVSGSTEVLLIPLFPHYAMSSYETAVERVKECVAKLAPGIRLTVQPAYYNRPDYIAALVTSAASALQQEFDHLLFSFHGVPERQIKKSDPTRRHCLTAPGCCEVKSEAHAFCYRHQCFATATAFAARAELPSDKWSVSFQSRLGKDPWLRPYTDVTLEQLPAKGVRKLLVLCPAFVSDCLETLEGNRHAWQGQLPAVWRGELHDDSLPERASGVDCGAGEHGARLHGAMTLPKAGEFPGRWGLRTPHPPGWKPRLTSGRDA
jgi:protoporphyrin/coproporphyrin ferrochelatase